jgi:hypothetical protein
VVKAPHPATIQVQISQGAQLRSAQEISQLVLSLSDLDIICRSGLQRVKPSESTL